MIESLVDYPDSLVKVDTISINGIAGREYLTKKKGSVDLHRRRFWVHGDRFYHQTSYIGKEEIFNNASNTFFSSFTPTTAPRKVNLYTSKASLICDDLLNKDTTIYKNALGALSYYTFKKEELPIIYAALQKTYTDDTLANGARSQLVKIFETVHDDESVPKLKSLFGSLKNADPVKESILTTLPEINKKEGFGLYFKLLTESKPIAAKNSYKLFSPLSDSLEFVAANFDKVLPLLNDSLYRYNVLQLATSMIYRDTIIYKELIKKNVAELTKFVLADLNGYVRHIKNDDNHYQALMFQYLNIMDSVKCGNLTDELTSKLTKSATNKWIQAGAVTTRVSNNLPNDSKLENKLLDSLDTRYAIIYAYNKMKQTQKVPVKYTKQDEMARLCLHQYLSDDDSATDKIVLNGSLPVKDSVYYVFTATYSGDEQSEVYRSIIGPYKVGSTKLDFEKFKVYTDWETPTGTWLEHAKRMLAKLKEEE
jgi:hypothetical protein